MIATPEKSLGCHVSTVEPSKRDCSIAAAMHIGTIFAPVLAPVIAMGVFRSSSFVYSHAKRSLVETIVLQAILLVLGACSLAYTVYSLYQHYQTGWENFSIWPMLIRAAVGYLALLVLGLINTVTAIRQALRAYRGDWPKGKRAPAALAT